MPKTIFHRRVVYSAQIKEHRPFNCNVLQKIKGENTYFIKCLDANTPYSLNEVLIVNQEEIKRIK